MSSDLAYLRGQNQNEQLAVPLLRLAGAVQAALAWQHKVWHPNLALAFPLHETLMQSSHQASIYLTDAAVNKPDMLKVSTSFICVVLPYCNRGGIWVQWFGLHKPCHT